MRNLLVAFALGAVIVGVVVFSLTRGDDGAVGVGVKKASASCTDEHPCLPGITLIDTYGKAWTPEEMAGQVVVINFWATWCKPCQAEAPALSRLYREHKDEGLILLGIMTDGASDMALAGFSDRYELYFPVVRLDDGIASAFGYPDALPTTFVYDRQGHLVGKPKRGAINEEALETELKKLLASK